MSPPVDIRGAQLIVEGHRPVGHHQDPKCRCGSAWPCRPRIAAGEVLRSVLVEAFYSVGRP